VGIHAFGGSGITIGSFTTIGDFATLQVSGVIREPGSHIRIGEHSSVGIRNFLHGGGGISIGNNCLLGPNVSIFSENHGFRNISKLIRDQQAERAEVVIGDNVWVGANSVILAGVAIGDGAVIAAGSVVTKHVDSNEVFGGVPAKKIGHRGE
jgi:acetyltransferase-like isoleucine patch superfamily enzyme